MNYLFELLKEAKAREILIKDDVDLFLLNGRITLAEYDELTKVDYVEVVNYEEIS